MGRPTCSLSFWGKALSRPPPIVEERAPGTTEGGCIPHGDQWAGSMSERVRGASPIRVALLERQRLVLDGIAARLSDPATNIEVVVAETHWDALVAHPGIPVDVVVLDLHSAEKLPLATRLRQLVADGTAVVALTGHTDLAAASAALRSGALGLVPKSEPAEVLITAIVAAAAGESFIAPSAADALANRRGVADAGIGKQELRALVLFAGGRTIREVAAIMGTTDETVKSYLKRGRLKFKRNGVDLGTRLLLKTHAVREGWIRPD